MPALRICTMVFTALVCGILLNESAVAQQKTAAGASQKTAPPAADTKKVSTVSGGKGVNEILNAGGWPIHITYFESTGGKESPVVILLTSSEGSDKTDSRNRQIWQPTALALQKGGFAVVTADLRKNGDSILPVADGKETPALKMGTEDYALMAAADLEAIKAFLMNEHTAEKLNIRKLGIVSMGSSAMVASAFAVADWDKKPYPDGPTPITSTPRGQDVQALIAYSPNTSVKGLNSTVILKSLKAIPVAIYVVASKDVKDDLRNGEKFYKAIDPKEEALKEYRKLMLVPGDVRAERFLDGKFTDVTTKDIVDFLTKHLKERSDLPWASRKDRRTN
jgi:hypothetical protein